MKRKLLFSLLLLLTSTMVMAQVTTSGISGIVTADNEEAIGATITAKHVPSGSVYRAVTNVDGRYTISGMRTGGPYEVEISYIGFQSKKYTDVQLQLGQNTVLSANLAEGSEMLAEVEVVAKANNTMRSDRSGAVTNLNAAAMSVIPTVGRSMTDLMKMTRRARRQVAWRLVVVTIASQVSPLTVRRSTTPSDWAPHHCRVAVPPSLWMPLSR